MGNQELGFFSRSRLVAFGGSEPEQGETVDFFLQLTWRGLKVP